MARPLKPGDGPDDVLHVRLEGSTEPGASPAEIEIRGRIAGVTLDVTVRSPGGGGPLLELLDSLLGVIGPPAGRKPPPPKAD